MLANIIAQMFRLTYSKFNKDLNMKVGNDETLLIKRDDKNQYSRSFFKTNVEVVITRTFVECENNDIFRSLKSEIMIRIEKQKHRQE